MLDQMIAQPVVFNKLTEDLGVSGGTIIILLILLYFVIKWAVRNGIKEAYTAITGEKTAEDIEAEKMLTESGAAHENAVNC